MIIFLLYLKINLHLREKAMKIIGQETMVLGGTHRFLIGKMVKIIALHKQHDNDPDQVEIFTSDQSIRQAGGVKPTDIVVVQPWVPEQGRYSWVTSDVLAHDLDLFSGSRRSSLEQLIEAGEQDASLRQPIAAVLAGSSLLSDSEYQLGHETGTLTRATRNKIATRFGKEGLDGNGRFRKPQHGYMIAIEILREFGVEMDTVVSSHVFNGSEGGTRIHLAFTNREDPFSPTPIKNSLLILTFHDLGASFEVLCYMS